MQCFICAEEMRVVMVEPHAVDMQGFELRTFQCVGCGDVEKHPVFDGSRAPPAPAPAAIVAPEVRAPLGSSLASNLASSKVKAILGGLVRLRGGTPNP